MRPDELGVASLAKKTTTPAMLIFVCCRSQELTS